MATKTNPAAKLAKSLATSSLLSFTLAIQKSAHRRALPVVSRVPRGLLNWKPRMSPWVEMTSTPTKLTPTAAMLTQPILCFRSGTDSRTTTSGQIMFSGCAS